MIFQYWSWIDDCGNCIIYWFIYSNTVFNCIWWHFAFRMLRILRKIEFSLSTMPALASYLGARRQGLLSKMPALALYLGKVKLYNMNIVNTVRIVHRIEAAASAGCNTHQYHWWVLYAMAPLWTFDVVCCSNCNPICFLMLLPCFWLLDSFCCLPVYCQLYFIVWKMQVALAHFEMSELDGRSVVSACVL